MRKIALLGLCLLLAVGATAKVRVGIKGGLLYSDYKAVDVHQGWDGVFESSTAWNAGVFARFDFLGIHLQPELLYSEKGTDVLKMKYLDFPLNLRVNLLGVPKIVVPFIVGGPFVSYALDGKLDIEDQAEDFDYKKLDYGLGVGVGCDLFNRLQITARYDWGMGKVADGVDWGVNAKSKTFSLALGIYL